MTASELRIGNWVTNKGGVPFWIFDFWHDELEFMARPVGIGSEYAYKLSELDPIPLTEEILLKAGFKPIKPKLKSPKKKVEYLFPEKRELEMECIGFDKEIGVIYWSTSFKVHATINSLHQLQNLYFALTGKELEINLWQ